MTPQVTCGFRLDGGHCHAELGRTSREKGERAQGDMVKRAASPLPGAGRHSPPPPPSPPPLPVQNITRKTGEEVTKRAVVIRDRSGGSIELTLWGAAAADPGQALHDMVVQVGGSCVCVCVGGGGEGHMGAA